jgi:hypothetical protein
MKFPVRTVYGHSFEHNAIVQWVAIDGTCPLTRKPLLLADLQLNTALRKEIMQWLYFNCLRFPDDSNQFGHDNEQILRIVL